MQYNFYGAGPYVNVGREVYLEPSRISTMGHFCENYEKALS